MSDDNSRRELYRLIVRSQETEIFVFAILVGAFIGGGIGLLYAPMEGSETRKVINENLKKAEETIRETFTNLKPEVEALVTLAEETATEIRNIIKVSKPE